jgi:hypothetical protein
MRGGSLLLSLEVEDDSFHGSALHGLTSRSLARDLASPPAIGSFGCELDRLPDLSLRSRSRCARLLRSVTSRRLRAPRTREKRPWSLFLPLEVEHHLFDRSALHRPLLTSLSLRSRSRSARLLPSGRLLALRRRGLPGYFFLSRWKTTFSIGPPFMAHSWVMWLASTKVIVRSFMCAASGPDMFVPST